MHFNTAKIINIKKRLSTQSINRKISKFSVVKGSVKDKGF